MESPSVVVAARKSKIGLRTLHSWLTQEPFVKRLQEERSRLLGESRDALGGLFAKSVRKLSELIDNTDPKVSLRAVQLVLEHCEVDKSVGAETTEESEDKTALSQEVDEMSDERKLQIVLGCKYVLGDGEIQAI